MSKVGTCPPNGQASHIVKGKQGFQECPGNVREICEWLDGNSGHVIKKSKIADLLSIYDKLAPELLEQVKKRSHATGEKQDEHIGVKDAIALSKFENHQEQKDLAQALLVTREQHGNLKNKNLTIYKQASEEIKQQVRNGELDLADVQDFIVIEEVKEEGEKRLGYEFIPNFSEQMRKFDLDVVKLEEQVNLFREFFDSKDFKQKYSTLKIKQKQRFNTGIFDIEKRIKKCYEDVESFITRLPDQSILLEGGDNNST